MKVNKEHRGMVAAGIKEGEKHMTMQKSLETAGLTNTQANNCVRNQRKKAGVYGRPYVAREVTDESN